jgi:pimeloyl-ACP methyl ester carboxylesterase
MSQMTHLPQRPPPPGPGPGPGGPAAPGPGHREAWLRHQAAPRREVLVLAGRHDRTCPAGASQDMARRLPNAQLVVFENSAHMMFAKEQDRFLATVRQFPGRITS